MIFQQWVVDGLESGTIPAPFFGNDSLSTPTSILVKFKAATGTGPGGSIEAYELSLRSLYNQADWAVVDAGIGASGSNISDVQVVSVRVNQNSPRLTGTFRLGIERGKTFPEDFQHPSQTPRIPFDATASMMKDALASISSIKIREVKRCDEISLVGDVNSGTGIALDGGKGRPVTIHGEYHDWVNGCPYNVNREGGYRWLIVFDVPTAGGTVPKLIVMKNELTARTWTSLTQAEISSLPVLSQTEVVVSQGVGPQILITRITKGMYNPSLCIQEICTFNVTALKEGTPYMFRMRVLTSASGWSDYSKVSDLKTTLETRPPSRPRPPTLASVSAFTANILFLQPPSIQGIFLIESQYRLATDAFTNEQWVVGPYIGLTSTTARGDIRSFSLTIVLEKLKPNTAYVARIRTTNRYGSSVYSAPSDVFTTSNDLGALSVPPAPEVAGNSSAPVTSSSVDVMVRANPSHLLPAVSTSYKLKYRIAASSRFPGEINWHTAADTAIFYPHREGVEIQRIVSRSTGEYVNGNPTYCAGSFWLQLGVSEPANIAYSVTPPIPFDASIADMEQAIRSIGAVRQANPRITIHRLRNQYNGYTWTVEVQGMGDITRLKLFKHTLFAVALGDDDLVRVGDCYVDNPATPIVTATIKDGNDVFSVLEEVITVRGLLPSTLYEFRSQLMDPSRHDYNGPESNSTLVKTIPVISPMDSSSVLTIGMDGIIQTNRKVNVVTDPRRDYGKATGPPIIVAGSDLVPAKTKEEHYMGGAGWGGLSAQHGHEGLCIAITYNPRLSQPNEVLRYFFTGTPQILTIPGATPEVGNIGIVTFKCWGGGGGGAKLADLGMLGDLDIDSSYLRHLSTGGGGAYAQISIYCNPGDAFSLVVGGGGKAAEGQKGGAGGYGGGGRGGDSLQGGGGGGGGASIIKAGDAVLLVAAGGGGGGSTDYCCAGGGAGGTNEYGIAGSAPGPKTPWPLSAPASDRSTPLTRRFEYTSSICPNDASGRFCLSEWDIIPGSLPAEHQNIGWGAQPNANYTYWATPGLGGGPNLGGKAGDSGTFTVRTTGDLVTLSFGGSATPISVFSQGKGLEVRGTYGAFLIGGDGAEGKNGGGGGGGGYWGGGGGGSGLDAAGGGGGSSYLNTEFESVVEKDALASITPKPMLVFVNESAATIVWTLRWNNTVWGSATSFAIETSAGTDNQEFSLAGTVDTTPGQSVSPLYEMASYTLANLSPLTAYAVRVVPVFPKGRGLPSQALVVNTLNRAVNYWEPVFSRRVSRAATGRGFSNPVADPSGSGAIMRPHLTADVGVQIYSEETSTNPLRYSDPDSSTTKMFPSSRRGHSFSFVDHIRPQVYLIGGRTDGYSCSLSYKDTLDLGTPQSGIDVYPCTASQTEVSELWSFDIHTYKWVFLDMTLWQASTAVPPAREQHIAAVADGNIYIFGGKARRFQMGSDGKPILKMHSDVVYGDFFRLDVPRSSAVIMEWTGAGAEGLPIAQDSRVFVTINGSAPSFVASNGEGINARTGKCIESVVVKVTLMHPCINQIRLSIMGPGPQTGSPNFHSQSSSHEVLLFNQRKTNGTGCISGTQTFIFDENSDLSTDSCCKSSYSDSFFPEGRLSEFVGASTSNEWTLVIQDMKPDELTGSLIDWEIDFVVSPCVWSYTWTNLTSTIATAVSGEAPVNRYGAKSVVYGSNPSYIFVLGGHDRNDNPLRDLYRFDTNAKTWKALKPVNFFGGDPTKWGATFGTANSAGSNYMLTSWGILRYGGYFRQPYMNHAGSTDQYTSDVYLEDPSTLRWTAVDASPCPEALFDGTTKQTPLPRYLAAAVFIPSHTIEWRRTFSYRNLYDQYPVSSRSNYASSLADSILLFGGHMGSTGSTYDGSTGGLLGDLWMLRLANLSTDGQRFKQQRYLEQQCLWRTSRSEPCLGTGTLPLCSFRDLIMLGWCAGRNQTM